MMPVAPKEVVDLRSPTVVVDDPGTISSGSISGQVVQPDVSMPTRAELAKAIRAEAKAKDVPCNRRQADRLVNMLGHAARQIRRNGYDTMYHIQQEALDDLHNIMDVVIVDDVAAPESGSAHALINRSITRGDEISVVHTKSYEGARTFCAVALELRTV